MLGANRGLPGDRIDLIVSRVVSLDEMPAALSEINRGHTLGKVVVHP